MSVYVLEIEGVARPLKLGSLSFQGVVNGRDVLSCSIVSPAGAYRPACGDEVVLTEDGTPIFGGYIKLKEETGAGGQPIDDIETRITCDSYNVLAERRLVTETILAGSTLEDALDQLAPYLTDYGVTLDAGQVTGPTLAADIVCDAEQLSSVLNKLSTLTDYLWEIDPSKTLRMFQPGSVASPVDFIDGDGNHVGDIRVSTTQELDVTRVYVKFGKPGVVTKTIPLTFDGVEDTFELKYELFGYLPYGSGDGAVGYAFVTVNGGIESLGGLLSPATVQWEYDPVAWTITRRAGAPAAGSGSVDIDVQFPMEISEQDPIVLTNPELLIEKRYEFPDVQDEALARQLALAILARSGVVKTEAEFDTLEPGVMPGMSFQFQATERGVTVATEYLVTEVNARSASSTLTRRTIKAIEGAVFRGSFRDLIQAWLGGGGASAVSVSGVGPTVTNPSVGIPVTQVLQLRTVTITNAEILDLHNNPKELAPAPGVGFVNVAVFMNAASDFTTAYDQGGDWLIRYAGQTYDLTNATVFATFQTGGYIVFHRALENNQALANAENRALVTRSNVSVVSGGHANNVLIVTVGYYVAQVP